MWLPLFHLDEHLGHAVEITGRLFPCLYALADACDTPWLGLGSVMRVTPRTAVAYHGRITAFIHSSCYDYCA